jgi:HPt (histidine-containing phosphotransfer) domain-containing protein
MKNIKNIWYNMFTQEYLKLLSMEKISKICSKPYGFELLILLYNFSKDNSEHGIEETFEMIRNNVCKRPAFLSFIKDLEAEKIIVRSVSKVKKSRILLRLNQDIIDEIDQVNGINQIFEDNVAKNKVLMKLFETNTREKILGVWWVFFEQLEHFINKCERGAYDEDYKALVEVVHKLKASSKILGQDLLEKKLIQLENNAKEDKVRYLADSIESLKNMAKNSENMFEQHVSMIIKNN